MKIKNLIKTMFIMLVLAIIINILSSSIDKEEKIDRLRYGDSTRALLNKLNCIYSKDGISVKGKTYKIIVFSSGISEQLKRVLRYLNLLNSNRDKFGKNFEIITIIKTVKEKISLLKKDLNINFNIVVWKNDFKFKSLYNNQLFLLIDSKDKLIFISSEFSSFDIKQIAKKHLLYHNMQKELSPSLLKLKKGINIPDLYAKDIYNKRKINLYDILSSKNMILFFTSNNVGCNSCLLDNYKFLIKKIKKEYQNYLCILFFNYYYNENDISVFPDFQYVLKTVPETMLSEDLLLNSNDVYVIVLKNKKIVEFVELLNFIKKHNIEL